MGNGGLKSAVPLEGDLLLLPKGKRGGSEPLADRLLALSAPGMLLDPGLGGALIDFDGNVLELYGGKDICGTALWGIWSSSSSGLFCCAQPCFTGICFLRGDGFPLSYLSLGGTGGFGIIASCSPRALSCGVRSFSGWPGFLPGTGLSLSNGGPRRSSGGFVLLSIEGAGGFEGLTFLSLLPGRGGKAGREAPLPPNEAGAGDGPGRWGGTGG